MGARVLGDQAGEVEALGDAARARTATEWALRAKRKGSANPL